MCDAAIIAFVHNAKGEAIDIGRKSRTPTTAQRRLLKICDRGCRFPGCGQTRFVDGHHIIHWVDGGRTDLTNLILLCEFHHTAIHKHGYTVARDHDGNIAFGRPDGTVIPPVEPMSADRDRLDVVATNIALGLPIDSATAVPRWEGDHLNYGFAIDGLLQKDNLHDRGIYPFEQFLTVNRINNN